MSTPPLETNHPQEKPSYTRLAMRHMVRRKGTSLVHFGLTTLAVVGLLIGLAVAFH
jgi:hypothetical protein